MYIQMNNNTGLCVTAVLSNNESSWLLHVHRRQTLKVTALHQNNYIVTRLVSDKTSKWHTSDTMTIQTIYNNCMTRGVCEIVWYYHIMSNN